MRAKTRTRTAFAAAVVASFLILVPGLSAKERRGSMLIVTRIDGSQVSGELIAVKPDSLFLLGNDGQDLTVGLSDIRSVQVVRKSRALTLALAGFAAGAAEAIYVTQKDNEDRTTGNTVRWALGVGGAQALLGLGVGLGLGADAVLPFAGESDEVVRGYLEGLKGRSREGRVAVARAPAKVGTEAKPLETATRPGQPPQAPSGACRRPRFRLGLGATWGLTESQGGTQALQGSWRFLEDVPPQEAGPFALPVYQPVPMGGDRHPLYIGPLGLAYEWTERWLAEVEFFAMHGLTGDSNATASFVSTTDGKTYIAGVLPPPYPAYRINFDSLLVGGDYRLIVPDRLKRASVEIGAAAGPARVGVIPNEGIIPAAKKVVLSFRVHSAFDYYFVPAFSLGVYVVYRYIKADFPPVTGTGEVGFHDEADYYPYTPSIIRLTEVNLPGRSASRTGLACGIRVTFRL